MSEEDFDEEKLRFIFKYWKTSLLIVAIIAAGIIAGVLVLLWQIGIATVPATLGQWSVGIVISFCLNLVFWELLLVGSWVAVLMIVLYFMWYTNLPEEDRRKWDGRGNRENSDAVGFFIGIAWLIMLYVDGRWNLTFDSWTFVDWIWSWLTAAFWVLLIGGIVIVIGLVAWFAKEKGIEA